LARKRERNSHAHGGKGDRTSNIEKDVPPGSKATKAKPQRRRESSGLGCLRAKTGGLQNRPTQKGVEKAEIKKRTRTVEVVKSMEVS